MFAVYAITARSDTASVFLVRAKDGTIHEERREGLTEAHELAVAETKQLMASTDSDKQKQAVEVLKQAFGDASATNAPLNYLEA